MLTKESVRKLIEAYSPEAFADVVKAACAPATFVAAPRVIRLGGGLPDAAVLGVVRDLPGENGLAAPLLVADVTLDAKTLTERSSRILQFKVARKVLEQVCVNPPVPVEDIIVQGVFAFHGDGGAFRISLVTAKAEDGKLVWSQVKRQSFYVENKPEQNATFIQRMTMNWSSLAAIREAFSVEKLTKEFYSQLFKWYERACEDERVEYPNDLATDKDNREDKNRKHLLRLITRLMFVWFLKKKGLVPELFFDEKALKGILKDFNPVSRKQHQYYRAILQNLFFATLNSEIDERGFAETPTPNRKGEKATTKHHGVKTKYRYADEFAISRKEVIERFRPIPFLNGGLFECLDQEGEDGKVMYYDGFSLQEFHRDNGTLTWAHVPNDLFFDEEYGIIPLLKRYNFTVEENTPGDEDVALDPELLGKVFENLLGAYNPETEEVVRKSTGSFYTPREIVNYMVDESLIAYLEGKVDGGRARTPAAPPDGRAVAPRPPSAVRALVKDGIRPDDAALCKTLIAAIESAKILDPACGSGAFPMGALLKMTELLRILKKLPEDANLYDLKLKLIENCIFGVDIQEIAVQISKLRFFISLVCEQEPDKNKPNYGIETLPNLETKFVAANSLIGLKRTDAKDGDTSLQQTDLFFDSGEIAKIKKDLWDVRHKHFLAKTRKEKNALRREDKELRTKLAKRGKELGYSDDATRLMASWDPYNQNVHADFFDPAWMFNVKDGFDVVIGNPPYIRPHNLSNDVKKQLWQNFNTFEKKADIYVCFIELALRLLANNAVMVFIVSDGWLRLDSFEAIREHILSSSHIQNIVDFSDDVFDSATVKTCVVLLRKNNIPAEENLISVATVKGSAHLEDLPLTRIPQKIFRDSYKFVFDLSYDPINRQIKDKIEKNSVRVDRCFELSFGLKTGDDEKFLTFDSKNPLAKKLIRGADAGRYYYSFKGEYVIYDPAAMRKNKITARPGSKGRFEQPKVLVRDTGGGLMCLYDDDDYYIKDMIIVSSPKKDCTSLKALLAILNSKAMKYYYETTFPTLHVQNDEVASLPLQTNMPKVLTNRLVALVDKILAAKKKDPDADTSAWEREIDELVYDLYGLTDEERKIVEGGGRGYPPSEASFAKQSGYSGATALPGKGGRARTPSAPQSGNNENALGGDCGGRGATALPNGVPGGGRGATRPTVARKPKTPKFEEEF